MVYTGNSSTQEVEAQRSKVQCDAMLLTVQGEYGMSEKEKVKSKRITKYI